MLKYILELLAISVQSDFPVPCDLHCLSVCHCSQVLSPALSMLLSCRVTLLKLKLWLELLLIKWMNCMKPCLKLLLKRFVNVSPVQCLHELVDWFYHFECAAKNVWLNHLPYLYVIAVSIEHYWLIRSGQKSFSDCYFLKFPNYLRIEKLGDS